MNKNLSEAKNYSQNNLISYLLTISNQNKNIYLAIKLVIKVSSPLKTNDSSFLLCNSLLTTPCKQLIKSIKKKLYCFKLLKHKFRRKFIEICKYSIRLINTNFKYL
ncbi:hypothetical protein BpHYR1_024959 [Brachionus plicatilis]|uniref:Uncharacterized protein n=1 Tax=Brachionus plicatilis TaxID=10195 RepID=A0A3M7P7X2_BRAPC|nr:hypothetical protein BpHYR1_024959 [Brachionus plicatilis]